MNTELQPQALPQTSRASRFSVRELCYVGIFTAIIASLSQLSIPMPGGVPMTLQTFIIPLAGVVLGARRGMLAALVYVLLGAVGAPVFAGFIGGLGIVLGPTGGFILSFPLMALAAGLGAKKGGMVWLILALVAGALVNYLCGMVQFSLVMDKSLAVAFTACVLPFLPTTVLKIALVGILGPQMRTRLVKSRVLT